jgi:enoyl-CoA hydratase
MREVLVEEHGTGGVLLIQLNRPNRSNAVNGALIAALGSAVETVAAAPAARVVVLTGAGKSFCAGGDLDYFAAEAAADPLAPPATAMAGILDRIAGSDRVWIAALNGAAIGGGLELALACHLRVVSAGATLSMRHLTLGLSPAWGGAARLFDAVGVATGLWLLLTGTTIDAAESLRLGLVQRVFGEGAFRADTLALAGDIAGRSPHALAGVLALAAAKRSGADCNAFRAAEQALFTERWRSPEFQARLAEHRARPRS